jgi:filamentous hemagglutinin family protein
LLLINNLSTNAAVTLDGTLGRGGALPGPDYLIGADLGRQHSGNLFHSFQDFNLNRFESATFSGPNNISNIISRVTGGNPSHIDGLIRSTIPNADMYFLNPYGIMFGENARLDVQGGFHASTADYLRLGDGGRFDARDPNESLLTIASIESFGFLNSQVAPISIQGHGEVSQDWENKSTGLSVREGKTLSLIGGEISIKNGTFFRTVSVDDGGIEKIEMTYLNSLHAPGGRTNLVAVASSGEIKQGKDFIDVSSFTQLANISITEQSLLKISGEGAGHLFIRGQDILFKDSQIIATSFGDRDNGIINLHSNGSILFQDGSQLDTKTTGKGQGAYLKLEAAENVEFSGTNINGASSGLFQWTSSKKEGAGDGGTVFIKAKNMYLDGSDIVLFTVGKGNVGDMTIYVEEQLSIGGDNPATDGGSNIYNSPFSASNGGNAGSIMVEAGNILIADGSYISGTTFGSGNGADITIRAKGTITLTGVNDAGLASGIFANTNPPTRGTSSKDAGNIIVEADQLIIEKGAMISSSTIATNKQQTGHGGNITIRVAGAINLSGVNIYGENEEGLGSGIFVYSRCAEGETDDAGNILIEADSLSITDGAGISSSTNSSAQGGNITIRVNDLLTISGDSSDIKLGVAPSPTSSQSTFQEQFPEQRLSISGVYANSSEPSSHAGNAGNLSIQAHNMNLTAGGTINTSTKNAGGGYIALTTPNQLYLREGEITTSVGGTGDGGNIIIENPVFVILNQGKIRAQADAGHGGDIHIKSGQFLLSNNSVVSASSRLGLDGYIEIDSPDENVAKGMLTLSSETVDASTMTKKPCEAMSYEEYENRSSFDSYPIAGSPTSPFDLQPSRLSFQSTKIAPATSQKQSQNMTSLHPHQMAVVPVCKPSWVQSKTQVIQENSVMPEELLF